MNKKILWLSMLLLPWVLMAQIKEYQFDTKIQYKITDLETNDNAGNLTQYINSKNSDYTLLYITQYESIFNAPNKVYDQTIMLIENQNSVVYLTNKDVFANEFIVNVQKDGYRTSFYDKIPQIVNDNITKEIGVYTCDEYQLTNIDEQADYFWVNSGNQINNVSSIFPMQEGMTVNGLMVQANFKGKRYKFLQSETIDEKFSINFNTANTVYQVLKKAQAELEQSISVLEKKVNEQNNQEQMVIGMVKNMDYMGNEVDNLLNNSCQFSGILKMNNEEIKNQAINYINGICSDATYFQDENKNMDYNAYYTYIDNSLNLFENSLYQEGKFDDETIKSNMLELRNFINQKKNAN